MHKLKSAEVETYKVEDPSNRVVPPDRKLSLLSRSLTKMPAERAKYFLDVARSYGATWPDRLQVGLEFIATDYPLFIELLLNQELTMTPDELQECVQSYLMLRREKELRTSTWQLVFVTARVADRKRLETNADVEITELFTKARVTPRSKDDPYKFVLVAYVCFPPAVARAVEPEPKRRPPPPPPLASAKDPIDGRLKANTEAHLRKDAGERGESQGVQAGTAARVTIHDKREVGEGENRLWYLVELQEPLQVVPDVGDALTKAKYLSQGTKAWIVSWGVDVIAASWAQLRSDLTVFDALDGARSMTDRITALRQRLHRSNLPFDKVIGTKKGKVYLENIPFDLDRWQLGADYQAFIAPDGRWVDLQHLMVGMDVLSRRETPADWNGTFIGSNWGASTWAGDVGSVAAEATLHQDSTTWERWNPNTTDSARLQFYFNTRASEHDLLGDLDPWGIQRLREEDTTIDKIDTLVALFYEGKSPGTTRTLTAERRFAVERFLSHYNFNYDVDTDYVKYPFLPTQKDSGKRLIKEIDAFGSIWMLHQNPNLLFESNRAAKQPSYVVDCAVLLLYWLECQAIENGAVV